MKALPLWISLIFVVSPCVADPPEDRRAPREELFARLHGEEVTPDPPASGSGLADLGVSIEKLGVRYENEILALSAERLDVAGAIVLAHSELRVSMPRQASLLLDPVGHAVRSATSSFDFRCRRMDLDLAPLEGRLPLPGGILIRIVRAGLALFSPRDIQVSVRSGQFESKAKSGLVHTHVKGQIRWSREGNLDLTVDSIRLNLGLPVPRGLVFRHLAWLEDLVVFSVEGNTIVTHVDRAAQLAVELLPSRLALEIPRVVLDQGRLVLAR